MSVKYSICSSNIIYEFATSVEKGPEVLGTEFEGHKKIQKVVNAVS
jgi:hypothetical protein